MPLTSNPLKLLTQSWYAWHMIPGYSGERCVPYCSPIYMENVEPLKTGRSILRVGFINVLYAEGVQDFTVNLRIIQHERSYLVAEILDDLQQPENRTAVISHIEFEWIRRFCPALWKAHPPTSIGTAAETSVTAYLNTVFKAATHAGRTA